MKILVVAAEFRSLVKVGGLGDVTEDLSLGFAARGHRVDVMIPYYGVAKTDHLRPQKEPALFSAEFLGQKQPVRVHSFLYKNLSLHLLEAAQFKGDFSSVYVDSAALGKGPFEDDSYRFAFFSTAVVTLLKEGFLEDIDLIHAHDWHTGSLPWLLKTQAPKLKNIPVVFTIHNLDYQGTRPLKGEGEAGVRNWWKGSGSQEFPWEGALDTRYKDCFNPLRAGIHFSHFITTVSPTYAQEILLPDDVANGFFGGRGLEKDLSRKKEAGHFAGLLNGIEYSEPTVFSLEEWVEKKALAKTTLRKNWRTLLKGLKISDQEALLAKYSSGHVPGSPTRLLAVMITRLTQQKVKLLLEDLGGTRLLKTLLRRPMDWVILGTGDLENQFLELNEESSGWLLRDFNPEVSRKLYEAADLFLMPSDFEPCGLSQLLAMKAGALPLAHSRGGLADTISHGVTGFLYGGSSRRAQKEGFLNALDAALEKYDRRREEWNQMVKNAGDQRFTWDKTLAVYEEIFQKLLG